MFQGSDISMVKREAKRNIALFENRLWQHMYILGAKGFADVDHDRLINRFQLCFLEKGRWRSIVDDSVSSGILFGGII